MLFTIRIAMLLQNISDVPHAFLICVLYDKFGISFEDFSSLEMLPPLLVAQWAERFYHHPRFGGDFYPFFDMVFYIGRIIRSFFNPSVSCDFNSYPTITSPNRSTCLRSAGNPHRRPCSQSAISFSTRPGARSAAAIQTSGLRSTSSICWNI